jgi:hypothetical protein
MTAQEVKRRLSAILNNEEDKNMGCGLVRSSEKVLICLLSVFVVVSLLFYTTAKADIYDDFSGLGIDSRRWTTSNPPVLFSQPGDGKLHFGPLTNTERTGNEKIVSNGPFGPGFFSMKFCDFTSTNHEAPGSRRGAFAALGLGRANNFVRILRDQNGVWNPVKGSCDLIGVFEVNYIENGKIQVHYVETNVTQGQLGLYYDGTKVTFYYNSRDGWKRTGWKTEGQKGEWVGEWTPNWTSNPKLYIQGYDLYGRTSFSVDNVEYTPVPNPPP